MRDLSALDLLTLLCAIGSGLIGGFFFAFSFTVMKALGKIPPAHGIAAMQSINIVVINPWFMTAFLGTGVACLIVIVGTFLRWYGAGVPWLLAGSLLYLIGSILVTMVFNVPRNDALAAVSPESTEGQRLWAAYLSAWTAWNTVRTFASIAASAAFMLAFRARG